MENQERNLIRIVNITLRADIIKVAFLNIVGNCFSPVSEGSLGQVNIKQENRNTPKKAISIRTVVPNIDLIRTSKI